MSIWSFLVTNTEPLVFAGASIASFLGAARWRTKAREATGVQIDQWASTAAGAVVLLTRAGAFEDHTAVVNGFLRHFRVLAAGFGIVVSPAHEHRALALANRVLVAAGEDVLADQAVQLGNVVNAMISKMETLPWPK